MKYQINTWDVHYASGGMMFRSIERAGDPDFEEYRVSRIPTLPELEFAYCTHIEVIGASGKYSLSGKFKLPRDLN